MTTTNSSYTKPFLTLPAQIRRLRDRGMDCGDDAYAAGVLERYGYYRLSGYWHLYRDRPAPPEPQFDDEGREIRLDTFRHGTNLAHIVSLYEFDHELRTRLGDALSLIETAVRFFVGHRLGRIDPFAHRRPVLLEAMRRGDAGAPDEPTTAYVEWLEEYDRHEKRARGDFVLHFRRKYGPHLPIWVATEVMSFGVLSNLYGLMRQADQEVLAARFGVLTADGHGDRGALGNWLNNLRNVRNICAHYGRLWNRTFDVLIDTPGQSRRDAADPLAPLAQDGIRNRLYGVLLIMRHLLLRIAPDRADIVDVVDMVQRRSETIGFGMGQLGFPDDWSESPIWARDFTVDPMPMLAASLLDRVTTTTASETRMSLTGVEVAQTALPRTSEQAGRATKAAQRSLLRTYLKHGVLIEIELGRTRHYPAFQFRHGLVINSAAEVTKELASSCGDSHPTRIAHALLDWWQTPHPGLPTRTDGSSRSPHELLLELPEAEFLRAVRETGAMDSFVAPVLRP